MNLLFVEDSPQHMMLVKARLHGLANIFVVETPDQANQVLSRHNIDLVFCDGHLPQTSGLEMLALLLEKNLPVIAHSSSDEYNTEMLLKGAKTTLNKKFVMTKAFLSFVKNAIELYARPQGS